MQIIASLFRILEDVEWANAAAGALVGAGLIAVPSMFRYFRSLTSPQKRKYRGKLYLYHWSGTEPALRTKIIQFTLSPRRGIKVVMPVDAVTHLAYTGSLSSGGGEVTYLNMEGKGHKERIFVVLYNPIHPGFEVTRGVMTSVTLNDEPMAWKVVLSRSPLEEPRAKKLLGARELLTIKKIGFQERLQA
jgi:hypothetical protein